MTAKKVLIAINAYSPEPAPRQIARIRDELISRGVRADVRRNDMFLTRVENGKISIDPDFDYDFCVYLDKDKYTARMLEKRGVRLFNSAAAIEACDDKMTTHILLADSGIPMPDTLPGPLCYDSSAEIKPASLDRVEKILGYPVIIKHAYGSLGAGVFKADDRTELEKIAKRVMLMPHLYQKYIAAAHGTDMRVIVVGDRVLGGMMRRSDADFRSNIGLGGKAEAVDVPQTVQNHALDAARILGLDYCGIDFLPTPNGYILCEVNSNAFFDAFEKATGVNVAAAYVEYMLSCF